MKAKKEEKWTHLPLSRACNCRLMDLTPGKEWISPLIKNVPGIGPTMTINTMETNKCGGKCAYCFTKLHTEDDYTHELNAGDYKPLGRIVRYVNPAAIFTCEKSEIGLSKRAQEGMRSLILAVNSDVMRFFTTTKFTKLTWKELNTLHNVVMLTSLTNVLNIHNFEQGTIPAKDRLKEMWYISGLKKNTIEQGVRILISKREEIPIFVAMF